MNENIERKYGKRIKNICKRWIGQWLYFSPEIAIGDFICSTILRKSHSRLKHNIIERYYEKAQRIIENKYKTIIDKWKNAKEDFCAISPNAPIFVFWWQGIENAPYIIKKCIQSIKENAGRHEVIILDRNNYDKYVDIPKYIINKVDKGIINITLFSDILRCCLLYENGGMWIDSTCYLTSDFDNKMYDLQFYSIKHGDDWDFPICKGYWATFFLASSIKNPLFGFMRELFFEFWKTENAFIVYLSIDLFLSIAYENFEWAKKMIDDVPYNNMHRDDLRNLLKINGGEDFENLVGKINEDTYINKLTYKMYIRSMGDEG